MNDTKTDDIVAIQDKVISANGFFVMSALDEDNELNVCYTIGRAEQGLPELIIYANPESGFPLISGVIQQIDAAAADGYYIGPEWTGPVYAAAAKPPHELVPQIVERLKTVGRDTQFKAVQLLVEDPKGRLPWHQGCEPSYISAQPLLFPKPEGRRHLN